MSDRWGGRMEPERLQRSVGTAATFFGLGMLIAILGFLAGVVTLFVALAGGPWILFWISLAAIAVGVVMWFMGAAAGAGIARAQAEDALERYRRDTYR